MVVGGENCSQLDLLGLDGLEDRFRRDRIDDGGLLRLLVHYLERSNDAVSMGDFLDGRKERI